MMKRYRSLVCFMLLLAMLTACDRGAPPPVKFGASGEGYAAKIDFARLEHELPLTPAFQGNLALSFPISLNGRFKLTPRVDGSYTSRLTFITPGSDPLIEQDGFFAGNGTLTLADQSKGWQLIAGVQNLSDERYLVQGNASLGTLGYAERIYARPRSWYVQLSAEF